MLITRAGSAAVPALRSSGRRSRVRKKIDFRFRSMTLSQPDSGNSSIGAPQFAPALFTRTCSAGSRCASSRASAVTPSSVPRSAGIATHSPSFASSASAALHASTLREQRYVRTPFSTKPRAIISPMPRVPPVTRATLPFTENNSSTFMRLSCRPAGASYPNGDVECGRSGGAARAAPSGARKRSAASRRRAQLQGRTFLMPEFCKAERQGRILVVTINRPDVMNSLHPPANRELAKVWDEFAGDPDLWIGIITGAGDRAFSAGNDLKYQATGGDMRGQPESGFGGLTSRFGMAKPVIAAVNGVAMGGGFEIALACDIIVASAEKAVFALPEPRVGLAARAGGRQRLPRVVALKQAMGMILAGRRVSAQEGKELGFVTDVAPHDELLKRALGWAEQILECSPLSIRASKQTVMGSLGVADLRESMENGRYPAIGEMVRSQDFIEGPKAFAEKRKPNWKGK